MSDTASSPARDRARPSLADPRPQGRLAGALGQLLVLAQLLGLALVVRAFAIESAAFGRVFGLVVAGYALQMVVPERFRVPMFVLLSAAGSVVVFGPVPAAWLVAIGLALIGIAHLPVPFAARVAAMLAAGLTLALFRGGVWAAPWSSILWPIFGAMFMFRMIVYLYDLRHRAAPFGFWRATAYFFMLPTVCFPLFPVVDYKTMWRTRIEGEERLRVHQRGAEWILRGLAQLLLYRLIYHSLWVDAATIEHASQALLYLVRPYLLYLRISGSFHLVIGIMHVFGFDLPRTNHNYFLASSFTDYWRRINVYWKDFLQKIFFNPITFQLSRRTGTTAALVIATLIAFFATWALHSYQWFWIRKTFPVAWQDIVFWSIMGVAVLVNMIVEARRGRVRRLTRPARSLGAELGLAVRTVATFAVIAASWAIWSTRSWGELMLVVSKLTAWRAVDVAWLAAGVLGLGLAAIVYARREERALARSRTAPGAEATRLTQRLWPALHVGGVSAALLVLVYAALAFVYPPALADVLDKLKNPLRLNRGDAALMDRGYYEELTDVTRFNPELAQVYTQKPLDWDRCWAFHHTDEFPNFVMLPSRRVAYLGAMMTTNRWAMRDRDYPLAKPANDYRIALLGDSHGMAGGVDDRLTFENVAEDRLNADVAPGGRQVEILNFSRAGYGPAARLWLMKRSVWPFAPDAVLVTGVDDLAWVAREVIGGALGRYAQPFPVMEQAAKEAGIGPGTPQQVAETRIQPYRERVLRSIYDQMVEECRLHHARPVAVFIPQPRRETAEALVGFRRQIEIARAAGFTTIDLLDTYDRAPDLSQLWVAPWDRHPNAAGHAMLADGLYRGLRRELGL